MDGQAAAVEEEAVRADQTVLNSMNAGQRHRQPWFYRSSTENDTHYQLAAPHHPLLKPGTPLIGANYTARTTQRPAINPWID